jgi:hypothetical protein
MIKMANNKKSKKRGSNLDKYKSIDERKVIVEKIREKLTENHIDGLEGVQPFHAILDEYLKEKIIAGFSGRVFVPELERYIEYILPAKKAAKDMTRLVVSPQAVKQEEAMKHTK